jgi:deoxyxylulose-5-phosphate synthase
MPIINSSTGELRHDYSVEQLERLAAEMRVWNTLSLVAANSGHLGGTL